MNQILTTEVQSLSLAKQAELLADLEGYVSVPVDIDTFIDDKYYLGNHFGGMWENGKYEGLPKVHPFWRNHLRDIFPNPFYSPYEEINLTGCFSGDTKVDLLDGRSLTFEEIYKEFKDKEFWVLAYNTKTNEWEPSKAYNPRISGYRKLVKITLDNGESFKCTPDHKFLTKDNKWIEAKDIIPNVTSLKNYNRKLDKNNYYKIWDHNNKKFVHLHKIVQKWKNPHTKNLQIHHKDCGTTNNTPQNLVLIPKGIHKHYHQMKGYWKWRNNLDKKKFDLIIIKNVYKGLHVRWNDIEQHKKASLKTTKRMKEGFAKQMADTFWKNNEQEKEKRAKIKREFNLNSENQKKTRKGKIFSFINKILVKHNLKNIKLEDYNKYVESIKGRKIRLSGIAKEYGCLLDNNRKCNKYSKINLEELKKYWPLIIKNSLNYNHKIISIEYLDKPEFVYNMTVDTYHNYPLNCGIIAKNCIGSGKSTIAIIGSLYDLYRLLLLKNPHSNFGLIQSTLIMVALFTATKSLGKTVLMSQVSDIFEISPFFKSRLTPKKDGQLFPNKIGIIQGSRFLHAVGIAVISGIMDEANESVVSNQALESYNHIRRRMQNRFMSKGGELPCRLWMVSSKKTDNSFLEEHINSKRDDPKTKIIEAAIWEVMRHRGIYSGYSENPPYDIIDHSKFFKVFVGDNNNDPFIIETKEMPSHIEDSRVINVPIEHKQEFISDILGSLRDLGGISSISGYKLFKDREPLLKALIVPPAFTSDIIRLTVEGQDSLKDFLTNYLSSLPNKSAPRYIHFDGAEKHDRFGLSMAYSQGIKEIQRFDALTGKVFTMQEHVVMHDFGVAIEAYPGSEIPWDKIREFIVWLRDILHFNISLITGDTHQSFYMLQLLKKQNFNCEVLSVDRTKDPYFAYKRAITENRVYSPKNDLLLKELFDVEDIGKKIDHSANGSKDLADSIVGSFFSCQENAHSSQLYSNRQIESMKKYLNKSSLFNPKNGRFI